MGKKDKEAIDRYYQSVLEGPKPRSIELLKADRIIKFLTIEPDEKITKKLPNEMVIITEIYDMTINMTACVILMMYRLLNVPTGCCRNSKWSGASVISI